MVILGAARSRSPRFHHSLVHHSDKFRCFFLRILLLGPGRLRPLESLVFGNIASVGSKDDRVRASYNSHSARWPVGNTMELNTACRGQASTRVASKVAPLTTPHRLIAASRARSSSLSHVVLAQPELQLVADDARRGDRHHLWNGVHWRR